jgi:glycine/D-amino acid oxidase-like deaminating enzyme
LSGQSRSGFPVGKERYNPRYDPLVSSDVGRNQNYPRTYWIATAGEPPLDDGPITGDTDADVVVIGSGYTGLSCAIHLAKEHGIKAVVLEANAVAWGCSTRNGGQGQLSSGRLKRSEWIKRWGLDVAKALHREVVEAFALFRDLVVVGEFDCEAQDVGHFFIAHKASMMPRLEAESRLLNEAFGYPTRMVGVEELRRDHVNDREAAGAMYEPDGIGVHAAKLAFGYLKIARRLGAKVHPASPVIGWETIGPVHHLTTPGGTVRTRAVAIATGGYATPGLHPLTRHRLMPILSNSIVTRPLSAAEKAACGFKSTVFHTDTRVLRHYYRLLPDDRVQIGSRSAITGADADNPRHLELLQKGLYRKFPDLRGVAIDYSWWGWVDVSHDMMPRIFQPDPTQKIFYALGYGGNGVMYSAQAGRRMAQLVAGKGHGLDLPIFRSPLPSHGALTPFRRLGQRAMYVWYYLKDEAF